MGGGRRKRDGTREKQFSLLSLSVQDEDGKAGKTVRGYTLGIQGVSAQMSFVTFAAEKPRNI